MDRSTSTEWRELGPATGHDERVSQYSELLARLAGLDPKRCHQIRMASRLHDVGKVAVPQAILGKPRRITRAERDIVQTHAEFGHRLLCTPGNDFLMLAATIALTHHERCDGLGYPRGLRGEEIPLEGRIVAICDVFDALTSDRVYHPAMRPSEALAIMRDGRGTQFDPVLLDLLLLEPQAFLRIGEACWRSETDAELLLPA